MPPALSNPYLIGAIALGALAFWFYRQGKGPSSSPDSADESDPYAYGHDKPGGGGAGGGLPSDLPDVNRGAIQNAYDGSGFVQDYGADYPSTSDTVAESPSGTQDPSAPSLAVTGAGAGSGVAGSGIPALAGGLGIGGYSQPSAPVAATIASTFTTPYSGGYTPYTPPSSTPYIPGTSSAGGGGSTRI